MKYMTCQEAASLLGLTIRRVQQMCKNGMIPGAIKKGRSWMIPKDSVEKIPPKDIPIKAQSMNICLIGICLIQMYLI